MRIFLTSIALFFGANLGAQRVLYSPFMGTESATRFEVIGKAGEYYWVQKSKTKARSRRPGEPWLDDKQLRFEIYDVRMNLLKTVPSFLSAGLVKEYLIPGDESFDQVLLQPGNLQTLALLNRYTPDGNLNSSGDTIAIIPAKLKCGDFLMIRSQDRSRILLLAFETIPDAPPRLHAFLYNQNWKLVYKTEYENINISKPLVQYDLVDYPLEDYNSTSVKLQNNGQWLMVVSSGTNRNYLLFHFNGTDDGFVFKQVKLAVGITAEDAALYIDNEKGEGFAGILLRARTAAVKNVRVVHYLLNDFKIDFDTSYYLNTIAGNKIRNENMFEEYFMIVPGKGFMFLKEYGRPINYIEGDESAYDQDYSRRQNVRNDDMSLPLNSDEYTRYDNLGGTRSNFDRGDLTLYYFPSREHDSCWSGIINKEQVTELGKSYLSYVFLPRQDKLFFLYNSLYRNSNQFGTTTVLDQKGNPINEGVEYWKINNTLVFQKARQIGENELAIPYEKNSRNGFAIIRL